MISQVDENAIVDCYRQFEKVTIAGPLINNPEMSKPGLSVKQLFDRDSCTYTYLLIDTVTGEGAIIDAVLETFDRDMQIVNELGVELLYAIETHAHADHITSAGKIRETTGAKLVYGKSSGIEAIDIPLEDGEGIDLGH